MNDIDGAKRILPSGKPAIQEPDEKVGAISEEESELLSEANITTTTEADSIVPLKTIVTAPTVQEVDQKEKELDEIILQLRAVGRSHKLEWGRGKKVPIKALLHAAALWLSDDPDDWTVANDTIFQFWE